MEENKIDVDVEITQESLAIEFFAAWQDYVMQNDSEIIGLCWDDLPQSKKEVWMAAVKPAYERLKSKRRENKSDKANEMKSSKEFFIQRWYSCFSLYSSPNKWLGAEKLEGLLTVRNFPCLKKLRVKDEAQDLIRITVEVVEEDATIKKCGPIHKGKYFRKRKRVKK